MFFCLVKEIVRTHIVGLKLANERMAKISATATKVCNTAASPAAGGPVKDMYDQISFIQWPEVSAILERKLKSERTRAKAARFEEDRVLEVERVDGRKMLRTSVFLHFRCMRFRPAAPGDSAGLARSGRASQPL